MPRHRRRDALTDPEVLENELPARARARVEALARGWAPAPRRPEPEEHGVPRAPAGLEDALEIAELPEDRDGLVSRWTPRETWDDASPPARPRGASPPRPEDPGEGRPGGEPPGGRRVLRWRIAPLGAAALAVVAVLAAATVLVLWRLSAPHQVPAPPRPAGAPAGTTGATAGNATGGSTRSPTSAPAASSGTAASTNPALVVDVAGAVRHPGVVELPAGARVQDGIRAAGGALAGAQLQLLNLARRLQDGEQVIVPAAGEGVAAGPAPGGATGSTGGASGGGSGTGAALDLNTATASDLDGLPGVGPVLAQRIVDWREQHGRFTTVDELREVSGIGDARFQDLSKRVRV